MTISNLAQAAPDIAVAAIATGRLYVVGNTERPRMPVTLEGRFRTESDEAGRFQFEEIYHPARCIVGIVVDDKTYEAVVSNCGQQGPPGEPGKTQMVGATPPQPVPAAPVAIRAPKPAPAPAPVAAPAAVPAAMPAAPAAVTASGPAGNPAPPQPPAPAPAPAQALALPPAPPSITSLTGTAGIAAAPDMPAAAPAKKPVPAAAHAQQQVKRRPPPPPRPKPQRKPAPAQDDGFDPAEAPPAE